jgi:hypothetical protein
VRRRCPGLKHVTEAADCLLLSLLSEGTFPAEGWGRSKQCSEWKLEREGVPEGELIFSSEGRESEEQDNGDSNRQW